MTKRQSPSILNRDVVEWLLSRMGGTVVVGLTGETVWMQRIADESEVIAIPAFAPVPPLPMPSSDLPAEVREELITRRHLQTEPDDEPLFIRGEMVRFEPFEQIFARGLRQTTMRRSHRLFSPRVIIAAPGTEYTPRKAALLDAAERAGARQVFIAPYCTACALGVGLDVPNTKAAAVLAVESDFSEFAVIAYGDELCHRTIPWGTADLTGPDDPMLERFVNEMHHGLDDLRDHQLDEMRRKPAMILGAGAIVNWLPSALSSRTGLNFTRHPMDPHPVLLGLQVYGKHLDAWKADAARGTSSAYQASAQ